MVNGKPRATARKNKLPPARLLKATSKISKRMKHRHPATALLSSHKYR